VRLEVDSSPMLLYAGTGTTACAAELNHFAIRRRFCAVAASRNSSRAPLSPRNRRRSSLATQLAEVEEPINPAQQVIGRNVIVKIE